uniref:zinc finger and SCAN domain containing 20 isoform 3 n=1 Tax=Rattus norvegicus TaxID=10116 RepID=UPI0033927326
MMAVASPPPEPEDLLIVKLEEDSWGSRSRPEESSHSSVPGPEVSRLCFRQFQYQDAAGPHEAFSQLWALCCRWLRPELRLKEQILELLVLEQFLSILPREVQTWVQARHPESGEEAVALVEDWHREAWAAGQQNLDPACSCPCGWLQADAAFWTETSPHTLAALHLLQSGIPMASYLTTFGCEDSVLENTYAVNDKVFYPFKP